MKLCPLPKVTRTGTSLWLGCPMSDALAAADNPETGRAGLAGIRERPPQPAALAADRRIFAGAGLLHRRTHIRPAFAAVQDAEAVGARVAGVGEGSEPVATLAAYWCEFHRAHLRRPDRRGPGRGSSTTTVQAQRNPITIKTEADGREINSLRSDMEILREHAARRANCTQPPSPGAISPGTDGAVKIREPDQFHTTGDRKRSKQEARALSNAGQSCNGSCLLLMRQAARPYATCPSRKRNFSSSDFNSRLSCASTWLAAVVSSTIAAFCWVI